MDRRSWLWRRKSSEKSPSGETESSGSLSSHSERFFDDQTNHNIQSPEFTSKAAPDDDKNNSVKSVSEKLNEALVNIRAKEDLVKQHAKVAEEAISGWERAEKEVLVLKKQNEALTEKNLILEERVGNLDGALKECLRQLRQAREDEDNIQNAVSKQVSELRTQLQKANADAQSKLEAAEKDKSVLKLQLEISSRERDLSTRAAEAASKQHLDSIKRVAKLEAECLQLKAQARRATSLTDSHSDDSYITNGLELQRPKHETTSLIVPSVDIYLMDDFLEMERLASLPEGTSGEETRSRDELEAVINRAAELEETLNKITAEKARLETDLSESQKQLALANEAAQREVEFTRQKLLEAEKKLERIEHVLKETNEAKCIVEVQLAESEARLKLMELELETSIRSLEKEKNVSREAVAKSDTLEAEISRIKSAEFQINQDIQLAMAATKFAQCQNTIASLGRQLKSLASFDDFLLDSERQVAVV